MKSVYSSKKIIQCNQRRHRWKRKKQKKIFKNSRCLKKKTGKNFFCRFYWFVGFGIEWKTQFHSMIPLIIGSLPCTLIKSVLLNKYGEIMFHAHGTIVPSLSFQRYRNLLFLSRSVVFKWTPSQKCNIYIFCSTECWRNEGCLHCLVEILSGQRYTKKKKCETSRFVSVDYGIWKKLENLHVASINYREKQKIHSVKMPERNLADLRDRMF